MTGYSGMKGKTRNNQVFVKQAREFLVFLLLCLWLYLKNRCRKNVHLRDGFVCFVL